VFSFNEASRTHGIRVSEEKRKKKKVCAGVTKIRLASGFYDVKFGNDVTHKNLHRKHLPSGLPLYALFG
jgi:hypothetical protein